MKTRYEESSHSTLTYPNRVVLTTPFTFLGTLPTHFTAITSNIFRASVPPAIIIGSVITRASEIGRCVADDDS